MLHLRWQSIQQSKFSYQLNSICSLRTNDSYRSDAAFVVRGFDAVTSAKSGEVCVPSSLSLANLRAPKPFGVAMSTGLGTGKHNGSTRGETKPTMRFIGSDQGLVSAPERILEIGKVSPNIQSHVPEKRRERGNA